LRSNLGACRQRYIRFALIAHGLIARFPERPVADRQPPMTRSRSCSQAGEGRPSTPATLGRPVKLPANAPIGGGQSDPLPIYRRE
jgi:hypothetical protein